MNREILFRGKSKDGGEWAYGNLVIAKDGEEVIRCTIYDQDVGGIRVVEVIPETVGQYLETKDKNNKKIFEGDVVQKTNNGRHPKFFVTGNKSSFLEYEKVYYGPFECFTEPIEYEIIGNVYDNPELVEVKE